MKFDIAVILINYNSCEYTISCIRSINEKTSKDINYQIIITDNASEDVDYLTLKSFCETSNFTNVELHRSNLNTGFGAGNMLGTEFADAKYLAFINNDTLLQNDCLSILIKTLENNHKIGIAGPQAYKKNGKPLICTDHFASPLKEITGRRFLEKINPKKYPERKKKYNHLQQVNTVSGSFMFIKADDFYGVGGFDKTIFLYHEETDLCLRLAKNNLFAYLIPEAKYVHFHGASTEKSVVIKKELKISLLYVIRKHYGFWGFKIVQLFLIIKYFFSSMFKPKNWSLFFLVLTGAPTSKSLKNTQIIKE